MTTHLKSSTSNEPSGAQPRLGGWLQVAAVAVVSAVAGGLAAAWWHRKTLAKLQQNEDGSRHPDFRIPDPDSPED